MITAKKDKKTSDSDSSSNKNAKSFSPEVTNILSKV